MTFNLQWLEIKIELLAGQSVVNLPYLSFRVFCLRNCDSKNFVVVEKNFDNAKW